MTDDRGERLKQYALEAAARGELSLEQAEWLGSVFVHVLQLHAELTSSDLERWYATTERLVGDLERLAFASADRAIQQGESCSPTKGGLIQRILDCIAVETGTKPPKPRRRGRPASFQTLIRNLEQLSYKAALRTPKGRPHGATSEAADLPEFLQKHAGDSLRLLARVNDYRARASGAGRRLTNAAALYEMLADDRVRSLQRAYVDDGLSEAAAYRAAWKRVEPRIARLERLLNRQRSGFRASKRR